LTRLIRSLALMTVIKNLGRHSALLLGASAAGPLTAAAVLPFGFAPKSIELGGGGRNPTELPRWRAGFSLMREVEEQGGRREVEEQGQPSSPSRRSRSSSAGAGVRRPFSTTATPPRRPRRRATSLPSGELPPFPSGHLLPTSRANCGSVALASRGGVSARRSARPEEHWIWGIRAPCGTSRTPPSTPVRGGGGGRQ
jgi:hypothetical protein